MFLKNQNGSVLCTYLLNFKFNHYTNYNNINTGRYNIPILEVFIDIKKKLSGIRMHS